MAVIRNVRMLGGEEIKQVLAEGGYFGLLEHWERIVKQMGRYNGIGVHYHASNKWLKLDDGSGKVHRDTLPELIGDCRCVFCGKHVPKGRNRVIDHHHLSGNIRGYAHRHCNGLEGTMGVVLRRHIGGNDRDVLEALRAAHRAGELKV